MSEELYYRIITFCCGRPVMAANLDLIIIYGLVRMTVSTGVVVQALSSLTIYYTLLTSMFDMYSAVVVVVSEKTKNKNVIGHCDLLPFVLG
jgi:hypothetical protein